MLNLQRDAAKAILRLEENGERSPVYQKTLLNRKPKGLWEIRRKYEESLKDLGYTYREAEILWRDAKDMAKFMSALNSYERS